MPLHTSRKVFPSAEEVRILNFPSCDQVFSEDRSQLSNRGGGRGSRPQPDAYIRQESNRTNNTNESYPPRQPLRKRSFPPPYVAHSSQRQTCQDIRETVSRRSCRQPRRIPSGRANERTNRHTRKAVPCRKEYVVNTREKEYRNRPTIEISPGISLPLHGTEETLDALKVGHLEKTHCAICCTDIYCVQSATYILCPMCRVVWPMEKSTHSGRGGVGLGVTAAELLEWTN